MLLQRTSAANREGFDFCLDGDPSTVKYQAIVATVRLAKQHFKGLVLQVRCNKCRDRRRYPEAHLLAYMGSR